MKRLLCAIVLIVLPVFAEASVTCTTPDGASLFFESTGDKSLSFRFGRDTYSGSFSAAGEPAGARLAGDKTLEIQLVQIDGCWPGSTVTTHLVLRAPQFSSAFGWFELRDESGKSLFGGGVDCKVDLPIKP